MDAPSSLDSYEVLGIIGKGSFGVVSKIRRKADGRVLVWKEMSYGAMKPKEKELVVSEVNILRELRHPFIVRYYDRIIEKATTKLYIVMEYAEGGDLGQIIRRCKKEGTSVDESFVWHVFSQLVLALKECHRHRSPPTPDCPEGKVTPILHRDIKPGNAFLDAHKNVKLGDFGLARQLDSESKLAFTNVGTPYYMAPEMCSTTPTEAAAGGAGAGGYNEKSDIWALGCLLYELCALQPPFDAANHLALAVKINAGKFNRIPAAYSDDLHRAIRWMLTLDPAERPTVEQLECIPRLASAAKESLLVIKEFNLSQAYANKARELRAKEAELMKREAEVAKREAAVAAAERRLMSMAVAPGGGGGVGSGAGYMMEMDGAGGAGMGR